ncbi:MAG: hypothetical protein WC393_00075 [Candidatus Nanoarchaeia archaeon]|jgi:DNA-binding Lrp family transcriptional regulator
MIKHRIYEYILNLSHKKIFQVDIAKNLHCTEMYVSKIVKELEKKGIIIKENKNALAVINPFMICCALAFEKDKEKPLYFQAPDFEDTIQVLNKITKYYALTCESANKIKKNEIPKIIQAHLLEKHIITLKENFNQVPRPENANLIVYPANIMKFMYTNEKNGIKLANEWQILIDKIRENNLRNLDKI